MGTEIERKFLLQGDVWRALAKGTAYRQGRLNSAQERTVRLRTIGDRVFLTMQGIRVGNSLAEHEYPIPPADCNAQLAIKPLIEKHLSRIPHDGVAA